MSSKVIYNNTIGDSIMKNAVFTVKLTKEEKEAFQEFCKSVGLNPSVAINMFVRNVINNQELPFEVRVKQPNQKLLEAIRNVENEENLSKTFTNLNDLFEDLNA